MNVTRLLLIEDDEDDYIITRDLLQDIDPQGYELSWARTADEARKRFCRNDIDVCLLDYSLGAYTGLEILSQARQQGFEAPIIMLTGHDDSVLDAEALSAGAVDYLVKTQLTAARLSRAIRYAVARRDMEQERIERLRAEAENKSKSEFLAHLSHELRTPLTSILGYTDLLLQSQKGEQLQNHLSVIKRNGNHLLSLLNDVLDLSKIEAGRLEVQSGTVVLSAFLSELYQFIGIRAADKGIVFSVEAETDLPEEIVTDATRLRQILLNLLSNGVKFTDAGSLSLRVGAQPGPGRCQLSFSVVDTGIGLTSEEQKKLFVPFVQATGALQRPERGTGLGLAISRQLARLLGGDIALHSSPGEGSCFTFSFDCPMPVNTALKPWAIDQASHFRESAAAPLLQGRILVVDDLKEIRELVAQLLSSAGCDVQQAINGQDAISHVESARQQNMPFDLVVMDVQMPVMDGLSATRELRQRGCTVPIIALTAQTMLGERQRCLEAGCNEHLGKPLQPGQLYSVVSHHLGAGESGKKRVLLVEDDDDARVATLQLLEALGWQVEAAADGKSAFSKFQRNTPDLILLDINLPDINGFRLARKFRDAAYPGRLLAATGEHPDSGSLSESGFDGVLRKPYDIQALSEL